jgi:ribosomal protein S28E/S33
MAKKPAKFSARKEVRAIARERVGPVKAGKVITPKSERKPKYKPDPFTEPA